MASTAQNWVELRLVQTCPGPQSELTLQATMLVGAYTAAIVLLSTTLV